MPETAFIVTLTSDPLPGIIAAVSTTVAALGGNIAETHQHWDRPTDRFFLRVAFLGPSGSGKSTLLALLGGIQKPSAGKIYLGDEEVSRMGERYLARIRSRQVSTMLQGATRNLLPYATARQNIAFARLSLSGAERDDALADTELLDRVGLVDQADQVVSTMSGGQRQRLALACAVSTSPRLLLADEPTSQLSHADRDHVLHLIHSLGDDFGTTIVVVTHQATDAALSETVEALADLDVVQTINSVLRMEGTTA